MGRRSLYPPDEVNIVEGSYFVHDGQVVKVRKILGPDLVLFEYLDTKETAKSAPWDLLPYSGSQQKNDQEAGQRELATITDEEFSAAKSIFEAIKPLLALSKRTRADVSKVAEQQDVMTSTVYEWIRLYCESGHISALVKRKRGPRKGSKQLSPEVEAIIEKNIEESYLKEHQPPPTLFFERVEDQCKLAGIVSPHRNTLRNRLAAIPLELALRRRGNRDKAERQAKPMPGEFPPAKCPLECVQIDHCILDIEIVFEDTREPIGIRPWLTLAIDAYSRMIVGYFLSLLHPSAFAAGAALYMGIMPKKPLLQQLDLPGTWPIYGKMGSIHADNAREFKGRMLEKACDDHNIISVLRPVKVPEYGAYIERAIGNIAREMQKKKGATQRRPGINEDYDSVAGAVFTLSELESELVDWIVNSYHINKHSELNTTPLRRYTEGIMGDGKSPGSGLPPLPANPEKLRLDFLPYEKRVVQNYGVELDTITFYDPVLNKWINAPDPDNPKEKRKFIFRWDPRSIKFIWFFDPDLKDYFRIPTRDPSRPDISWSEYEEYKSRVKKEGDSHVDEEATFAYRQRSKAREETASESSRLARKGKGRKYAALRSPDATPPGARSFASTAPVPEPQPTKVQNFDALFPDKDPFSGDVTPFDDIEV
jgi:putative transposase